MNISECTMPQISNGNDSSDPKYQELPMQEQNGNKQPTADVPDKHDAQCGLGGLRCRCLQVLAHPNVFVLCVGLLFMASVGASGVYMSGVISTIEKRFQLKSSESGILLSMNDVTALCGVLFVTHFGGRSHRPRIIGVSGLVIAVGTFVTALPQFIFDNPELDKIFAPSANQSVLTTRTYEYEKEFTCSARDNVTQCTAAEIAASGSQLGKTWPMIVGQLLCGLGGCAILPLSQTYVDDAVEKTMLPLYLALMFLPMTIAPLFGYSISGYCLSIFTDFYKTDASKLGLSPRDPQWQGAWWLGFIIYGCLLCLFSIPFFLFPRKMSKPKSYFCCSVMPDCCKTILEGGRGGRATRNEVKTDVPTHTTSSRKPMVAIKGFLASLWRLLTNPIYMSSVSGYSMMAMSFMGFGAFAAKYIQFQFGISPAQAGLTLGFTIMPGSLVGLALGGIITARVAGNLRGYSVVTIAIHTLCVLGYGIPMFLGCPNLNIAGVTTGYGANIHTPEANSFEVYASCNMDCMCEKGVYAPVCGSDNMTYVTACFAGCKTVTEDQFDNQIYRDCSCINATHKIVLDEPVPGLAVPGACAKDCDLFTPFIVFLGIAAAVGSFSFNPSFMVKFRSVSDKDRSLSLGLSSFLSKIVGFIPSSIIFGAAIETQCSYWQESCQETGECILYDRPGLRFVFLGLTAGFRFLALLCFFVSTYCIFKKNVYQPQTEKENKTKEDIEEGTGKN